MGRKMEARGVGSTGLIQGCGRCTYTQTPIERAAIGAGPEPMVRSPAQANHPAATLAGVIGASGARFGPIFWRNESPHASSKTDGGPGTPAGSRFFMLPDYVCSVPAGSTVPEE